MSLSQASREQIVRWVRPLYVELDGIDTFTVVDRRAELVEALLGQTPVDEAYLELLLLFHGTVKRLGSTQPGGRWWLFLGGLGVPATQLGRLAQGLSRWADAPLGPEESALHDAVLLEDVGVAACARRLWRAGRKRVAFEKALGTLDAGPVPERFKTASGSRRAAESRAEAEVWLEELRRLTARREGRGAG